MRGFCLGEESVCVVFESSRARIIPRIVMMMAAVFVMSGMVIGGVFVGRVRDEISRPAMMLPKANRIIGKMAEGEFSLIGVIGMVRLYPVWTNKVMRKL